MNKRGQAAMEFLMTYGWAIVVVLAAIGALAYFGVLSPSKLLPDKTSFPSPLQNIDNSAVVSLSANSAEVAFKQNKGVSITIPGVGAAGAGEHNGTTFSIAPAPSMVGCSDVVMTGTYPAGQVMTSGTQIPNGETFLLKWTCQAATTATAGEKFKADVTFQFVNVETSQTLTEAGTIEGKYI